MRICDICDSQESENWHLVEIDFQQCDACYDLANNDRTKYHREYKRKQRENGLIEKQYPDKRGYRDRAEYMREYRKRKKIDLID